MKASKLFPKEIIKNDFNIDSFGYTSTKNKDTLTYLFDEKYLQELNDNENISGVITTIALASKINIDIGIIINSDPVSLFYEIFIKHVKEKKYYNTNISRFSCVSSKAIIDSYGVIIEDNVIIEDGAIIKTGVTIKKDSIIRSGAIIGGDGFEVKSIYGKQTVIPHDGEVIIGENVDIGHNTCVDKGMFGRDTIIEKNTKIDNLCHIAHGVQIGENTIIVAKVMISGSVKIEKNVYIGPGSTISNGIQIGRKSKISLGSTVVSNVKESEIVTGYFAISHVKYLNERSIIQKLRRNKNAKKN